MFENTELEEIPAAVLGQLDRICFRLCRNDFGQRQGTRTRSPSSGEYAFQQTEFSVGILDRICSVGAGERPELAGARGSSSGIPCGIAYQSSVGSSN